METRARSRFSTARLTSLPAPFLWAKDADSIGYDAASQRLYVVNGGKDAGQPYSMLSVIDTAAGKKLTDIRIDGETLEAMALDAFRPRLYVNNRARNQVTVVDRWKNAVVASWPVKLCSDNVAMALDENHQRLFVGCRSGQVAIFDTNTGKELQSQPITKGVDDMTYDAGSKRLYAIGGGMVERDPGNRRGPLSRDRQRSRRRSGENAACAGDAIATSQLFRRRAAALRPFGFYSRSMFRSPKPAEVQGKVRVHAPRALDLDLATLSAHPDLRKMGLHAIPPGGKDSVIIAHANTSRIGVASSAGDSDAVKEGKTYCAMKDDGAFYNMKLPLKEVSGRTIGILVMEIPYTRRPDEAAAVRQAERIRNELAQQIPDRDWLFR